MFRNVVILISLWLSVSALGRPNSIRRAVRPVVGSYIVVLDEHDSLHPRARAAFLNTAFGGRITAVWDDALHGFSIELSETQALALSRNPFVKEVEEDAYGSLVTIQTTDSSHWGLDRIDQRNTPMDGSYNYCQDGTGVNIYIVDTGVWNMHTDFDLADGTSNRVERGVDFVECPDGCQGDASWPCGAGSVGNDTLGSHGTKVASVAAGITHGVAKNATIFPVRALNCYGNITTSRALSAVNWVKTDHDVGEPAVMNCSFKFDKSDADEDALMSAVERVIDDGVIVVVAAGNTNESASVTTLPNISRAITVGATDRFDQRWVQSDTVGSNRGSKVDIFAPGKGIRVADVSSMTASSSNSGTSLAAPFVAGVVAQYLQVHPSATPAEVFAWVVSSGTPGVLTNLGAGSPNLLLYESCN